MAMIKDQGCRFRERKQKIDKEGEREEKKKPRVENSRKVKEEKKRKAWRMGSRQKPKSLGRVGDLNTQRRD